MSDGNFRENPQEKAFKNLERTIARVAHMGTGYPWDPIEAVQAAYLLTARIYQYEATNVGEKRRVREVRKWASPTDPIYERVHNILEERRWKNLNHSRLAIEHTKQGYIVPLRKFILDWAGYQLWLTAHENGTPERIAALAMGHTKETMPDRVSPEVFEGLLEKEEAGFEAEAQKRPIIKVIPKDSACYYLHEAFSDAVNARGISSIIDDSFLYPRQKVIRGSEAVEKLLQKVSSFPEWESLELFGMETYFYNSLARKVIKTIWDDATQRRLLGTYQIRSSEEEKKKETKIKSGPDLSFLSSGLKERFSVIYWVTGMEILGGLPVLTEEELRIMAKQGIDYCLSGGVKKIFKPKIKPSFPMDIDYSFKTWPDERIEEVKRQLGNF